LSVTLHEHKFQHQVEGKEILDALSARISSLAHYLEKLGAGVKPKNQQQEEEVSGYSLTADLKRQ
jgi:hypothetical protein